MTIERCLHNMKNSTIFKTKNIELAIFGNTLTDVKNKINDFNNVRINNGLFGENGAFSVLFSKNSKNIIDNKLIELLHNIKLLFRHVRLYGYGLHLLLGKQRFYHHRIRRC